MKIPWEIIPKITTPLAALCFLAGVIYLVVRIIIRSNNRKKEKSLKVKDPIAQRIAAEKILNDYPDLKIGQIDSDSGKVEVAKLIIQTRQNSHQRIIFGLVILSSIFAGAYLIPLIWSNKGDASREEAAFLKSKTWAELKAIKAKSAYAALSVLQHIKIRDVVLNGTKKRLVEFRNTYTLLAVHDIKSKDQDFAEEYTTSHALVEPWAGTDDQQIESNVPTKFWVKFDLPKNTLKTIVTGANYYYSFPMTNNNTTSCFGNIEGNPSEWMTCYPNETDYIDKLTILVETEGIAIQLAPISMYRKNTIGEVENTDGKCRVFSTDQSCTLVAQWDTLSPGECIAFKIKW